MFPFYLRQTVLAHVVGRSSWIFNFLLLVGCGSGSNSSPPPSIASIGTPGVEADVGERLFVETRFAQFFKAHLPPGGNVNNPLPAGDSVVAKVLLPGGNPSGVTRTYLKIDLREHSAYPPCTEA